MADSAAPPPEPRSERFASAVDGTRLHALAWVAPEPRAALLVSHGLGEHAGRYAALARDLVGRGVSVHALDHRGHGRSGGARAYAPRFDALTHDLEAFRAHVAADLPSGLPVFLLGHSLGGLIAVRYLESHPDARLAGAVLSAPLLALKKEAPRWKLSMAGILNRVAPALPLSNEIDPGELSHDEAYVRSYREDRLVHDKITPRLYTGFMDAIPLAVAERGRLALPLLFLVPGEDTIVDAEATRHFARSLEGDVTVREYPGLRHESLNEVERGRVVDDVAGWLEARLGG